jgi:hypothetical protein
VAQGVDPSWKAALSGSPQTDAICPGSVGLAHQAAAEPVPSLAVHHGQKSLSAMAEAEMRLSAKPLCRGPQDG